ncbi:protein phosphatase 2C domain-containing protein [Tenacibaculum jejuense]|uniref:PPM-type phosphatase domain-containing protein n=1 Tax=Tenacibaculum jejuense TaxID=584609 RepID=A0A238U408_9FLAO|nr:protein phosphatase 2C domain-containing protein [Tenacibaculum jejuense]SNR13842.1 Uncharacterized protein TJEJU_0032 [Tenacibaculum jejuense]
MHIDYILQIGEFHTNHCEDFLLIENTADHEKLVAVFDGCSSGNESVFASILFGKLLRNISKKEFHKDFITKEKTNLSDKLYSISKQFFNELKVIKNLLDLDVYELLSTLILAIVNTETKAAEILIAGDGLITVNQKHYDFESNDKPNYLAYHLKDSFLDWYHNQTQKITVPNFKTLSLATDGIFAFKNLKNSKAYKSEDEIISFLLHEEKSMTLKSKIKTLERNFDYVPTDDIAIIKIESYINE